MSHYNSSYVDIFLIGKHFWMHCSDNQGSTVLITNVSSIDIASIMNLTLKIMVFITCNQCNC